MSKTDAVCHDECEIDNQTDDFFVSTDVRRDLTITFINHCEFYPGEKIHIMTIDFQRDLINEYLHNNQLKHHLKI